MKIHLVGAEFFWADGQGDGGHRHTDITKLTGAFSNFVTVPETV